MTGLVYVAVLSAAVLHATWNAIAKSIPDSRATAVLISAAGFAVGAVGIAVLPAPEPEAFPALGVASLLGAGYLLLLLYAYRLGEFSRVYPLTRGLPPLLVAVVAFAVLGERMRPGQLVGVLVVSAALITLVFAGGRPRSGAGIGPAVVAGVFVAGYSVVDGYGVRVSGHPWSYAMWRLMLEGPLMIGAARLMGGPQVWRAAARSAGPGLTAGVIGLVAFSVVLWAQAHAPLAVVSALRETSLLFAGLIGTLVFGERFSRLRFGATVAAVAGIALLLTG